MAQEVVNEVYHSKKENLVKKLTRFFKIKSLNNLNMKFKIIDTIDISSFFYKNL
jgi:hypothetical protein